MKYSAEITSLLQKVLDGERRLKDETGEKNHWKQLYEELQKKFNDKIDYDIKARKSELERAHHTQITITEQAQEIERLREQLRKQENEEKRKDMEHETALNEMREKMKEMENKHADELERLKIEMMSLETEKSRCQKLLEERNVEITQLELKIEEVYKMIQGL